MGRGVVGGSLKLENSVFVPLGWKIPKPEYEILFF